MDSLEYVKSFFKADLKIKNELNKVAPNDSFSYSKEASFEYGEALYNAVVDMEDEFLIIVKPIVTECTYSNIKNKFEVYKNVIIDSNYNYDKLKKVYKSFLSDMNPNLIDNVKKVCIGYYLGRSVDNLFNECVSINELLHVLHSYVINNEMMYEKVPKLNSKINDSNCEICLRGKESPLSNKVFNSVLLSSNCGDTDILSLEDNRVLVMIRDKGHALSIEIEKEQDKIWVSYFIPKVCNKEMVKKLKGINNVNDSNAVGKFCTTEESFINDLNELIDKVPTDADMVFDTNYIK